MFRAFYDRTGILCVGVFVALATVSSGAIAADTDSSDIDPVAMARNVTIHRDSYGRPHIDGKNDEAVLFGYGYCQAEDYFWQLEECYMLGLGRLCELYGKQ